MSRRRAAGLAVVALALLGVGGCRGGRIVLPVRLEEPAPALHYPGDFDSHEAVVRGVATLLTRHLSLPVPGYITVFIYSSRAVFEQGLVSDGRLPVPRAAELSEFAVGVGKRGQVLLHHHGGPPAAREWVRLQGRLGLEQLGTRGGFTARHLHDGSLATYQLAFLMTDYLIRRHGFGSLRRYFQGFATGRGRHESFRFAFGQSLGEFEQDALSHLGQVLR